MPSGSNETWSGVSQAPARIFATSGIAAAGRELRSFGSQGEQRVAVLALVLAEAGLSRESRGEPPLLLLDDVLSELDGQRRRALLGALPPDGQTVVTTTSTDALPAGARRRRRSSSR